MRHHMQCRFCDTGNYQARETGHSSDVANLGLGLAWKGEDQPWTMIECDKCGNVQVFSREGVVLERKEVIHLF